MKNLKLFPKMFIQLFSVLGIIIVLIHLLVFFLFPISYLEQRKEAIAFRANDVSAGMEGRSLTEIENTLALYSTSSDIQVFIKKDRESLSFPIEADIPIDDTVPIDFDSKTNSMIIEEREIQTDRGDKLILQFISTADMQQEAKELSLQFLPYSLGISLLFSVAVSLVYAKAIKNNISEIKKETDKMIELDQTACLRIVSKDEVGELKEQINTLYRSLLQSIENVEKKNQEILKLEKLKYDFLKGASHELKTPLASLKIILENMQYNIGKYKDRDFYIGECITTVDSLSRNISQILSVSSLDKLKDDEESLEIRSVLLPVLEKYEVLKRFRVDAGDIIVSCRGTIGKIFVLPSNSNFGIIHPSLMKIKLKKEKYNNTFFEKLLEKYMQENLYSIQGSSIKMAITAKKLGEEYFIIPPIELQNEFSNRIEKIEKLSFNLY